MPMPRRLTLTSFTLLTALLGAPGQSDVVNWSTLGDWDVAYYPNSKGCQAFAFFEENTAFFIGYDSNSNVVSLDVTVLDPRWTSIDPDQDYRVKVRFGNRDPWTLDMAGVRMDDYPGLNIMIDAESSKATLFIEEFQRESHMTWSYGDTDLGRYPLRGSKRAFNEVGTCQDSYNADE
ncbi:MAG: hypothetical protein AB8B51_04065 [Sedimentitalea sp.]